MALIGDHLHIHVHLNWDVAPIVNKLDKALKLLKDMAKKTEELAAAVAEQNALISNIAGDLDRIAEKLENDPTEEEISAIAAEIRTNNEALRTISNRNLVPETETPTDPTPE